MIRIENSIIKYYEKIGLGIFLRIILTMFLLIVIANTFASDLHDAINEGDISKVHNLLEHGGDINESEPVWGLSPLAVAVCRGRQDIAELLLSRGADLNARDHVGRIALHCAIGYRHLNLAIWLVNKGSGINVKGYMGETPLHLAVREVENAHLVSLLLNKGARVDEVNDEKQTPLHQAAALYGNAAIVQLLIDYGADVNALDLSGRSPLSHALLYEHPDKRTFSLLLRHHANPNFEINKGCPLIHEATKKGLREIVAQLISYNADIHKKCNGIPLIHSAAGDKYFIELLAAMGLNVNEKDGYGRSIIHASAREGMKENTLKWLLSHGQQIDVKDSSGMTPLHIAAQQGNFLTVRLLISMGANVSIQDSDGMTALQYAIDGEHPGTAELLIDAGAKSH